MTRWTIRSAANPSGCISEVEKEELPVMMAIMAKSVAPKGSAIQMVFSPRKFGAGIGVSVNMDAKIRVSGLRIAAGPFHCSKNKRFLKLSDILKNSFSIHGLTS
jgi:hypothetical protein